jgi:diphthamide biosynthesis methyltransferase
MPAATDVLLTLKQARDRRMAKTKLIEVIVAREGMANSEATTAAVEKMIAFQIAKGRIVSEVKAGVEYLTAPP